MMWEYIKPLIKEHGRWQQEYYFGRFHALLMLLYTVKAIICIILKREKSYSYSEYSDVISEMAHLNYRETYDYNNGSGADWTDIGVGKNWNDWHYQISETGYP